MPLYEFECASCELTFEKLFKHWEDPSKLNIACPICNQIAKKLFAVPTIKFIGKDFYSATNNKEENKN